MTVQIGFLGGLCAIFQKANMNLVFLAAGKNVWIIFPYLFQSTEKSYPWESCKSSIFTQNTNYIRSNYHHTG